jgi:glycosyltransferase involved in cell wall biosynthesis
MSNSGSPRPRIGIVDTHPIQNHAPWYRALADRSDTEVEILYCHRATPRDQAKAGFGIEFDWDRPLLDGYRSKFLTNVASKPGLTFWGMDTPELPTTIVQAEYDAIILSGWHYKSAWQAIRACWNLGIPVLVRSDSHLKTPRSRVKSLLKEPVYRWFIPRFDACLPVGSRSKEYFMHYGAASERIFTVRHTIDVDSFRTEAAKLSSRRAELRAGWRVSKEAITYVFAGKLIDTKRPLDFIAAVARASRYKPEICGLVVGDGPLRAECERRIADWNAPIRFVGFLNQTRIVEAYVAADGLVLPSRETWGLVVNEAMACARPCFVSAEVGCGPDLIAEDKTGAIFPFSDINSLSDLLVRYSHPPILSAMGERARRQSELYTPAAAAEALLTAVDHTLRNGHRQA